jgi:hypothetical protein
MIFQFLRQLVIATSILLIFILGVGLQSAKADSTSIIMDVTAGGSGPLIPGTVTETITGTFGFNPTTGTIFNVLLYGTESVVQDGTELQYSEYWTFGPLSCSNQCSYISGGNDVFSLAGEVGSLGDVLEFAFVLNPSGSFVPAGGGGAIRPGSAATEQLNALDSWDGTITPVVVTPELQTCWLFSIGLGLFLIRSRRLTCEATAQRRAEATTPPLRHAQLEGNAPYDERA